MFCRNCGAEMSDTAKFCPKCGSARMDEAVANKKEIIEDNQIKYELKPEFNIPYKLITSIGTAILYMFLICYIFDLYRFWFIYPVSILITVGIMAIYVIVKMILEKMQYNVLEYNFYTTKVEYKDGFLNKEEKELKYKNVREVTMAQNVLERICGIGTIRIYTNATSGVYNGNNHNSMRGRNGIYIHCVENVRKQYEKIKEIIDEGTTDE